MRDTLKTPSYFDNFFKEEFFYLDKYKDLLNEQTQYHRKLGTASTVFAKSCRVAIASYSAGKTVAEVKDRILVAVDALEVFINLGLQNEDYFLHGDGGGYSGGFDEWYRLLGWCILFDLPRDKTDIVVNYLSLQMRHPKHAADGLVNKMVKALGYPGQDETDHLLWPQAYEPLYTCFSQEAHREEQLKVFVKQWYRKMRCTGWHNNHNGRHDTYFGYWCFEAAAVAKLLNIDDTGLKDHKHYPYDARHSA